MTRAKERRWHSSELRRRGDNLLAAKQHDEAIAAFSEAARPVPNGFDACMALADTLRAAHRRGEELRARQRALKLARTKRERAAAMHDLADPLAFFGRLEEAIGCSRRAVALIPSSELYWRDLAGVLIREHDAAAGLAALERAKDLAGESAVYHLWRGRAMRLLGQWSEAAGAFERSVALEPSAVHAWRDLAMACMSNGEYAKARKVCATKLRPGLARHLILAAVKCRLGRKDQACLSVRTALRTMEKPGAFDLVRWHYCNRKSHEELIGFVEGLSTDLRDCPWPRWILARLWAVAGDKRRAARWIGAALRMKPSLANAIEQDAYFALLPRPSQRRKGSVADRADR